MANQVTNSKDNKLKKLFTYSVFFIVILSYLSGFITSIFFLKIGNDDPNYLLFLLNIAMALVVIYLAKIKIDVLNISKLDKLYKLAKVLAVFSGVSLMFSSVITPLFFISLNELFLSQVQTFGESNAYNSYLYIELLINLFTGIAGLIFSYIFIKIDNPK